MSICQTLRASFPSAVEAGPEKARLIPNSARISTPICCAWGGIQGEPERLEGLHRQVTGYARDVFPDLRVDPHRFAACGETVHKWTRRREFLDPRCWTAPRPKCQRMVYGHTPKQAFLPELAPDGGKLNTDKGAV